MRFLFQSGCMKMALIPNLSKWTKKHRLLLCADSILVYAKKNRDGSGNGTQYVKQILVNIRSAKNRHFQYAPYNKPWDLMHDAEFMQANKVFQVKLIPKT